MVDAEQVINQAISDFDDIEAALKESGIDVPDGTDTSLYGDKVRELAGKTGAVVDQSYDPTSVAAQSGIAVAEALSPIQESLDTASKKVTSQGEQINSNTKAIGTIQSSLEKVEEQASKVNLCANAITGNASGEVIRVDDVSPLEHIVRAKVGRAKNLIQFPYQENSKTSNGVTFTVNDNGSITINGTAEGNTAFTILSGGNIPVEGVYTLSGITGGDTSTYYMQPYMNGTAQKIVTEGSLSYQWNGVVTRIVIFVQQGCTFDNLVVTPQLEQGDTATEYEPYIDPTAVTVTRCGKNLLPYPYTQTTKTTNEVTFTDNGDGSIVVNGAPTKNSAFALIGENAKRIHLAKGKTYRFCGNAISQSEDKSYCFIAYDNGTSDTAGDITYVYDYGTTNGKSFTPTEDVYVHSCGIVVKTGNTFNNVKFTPQLELGDTATGYEPYTAETYTPNADGTVEIASLAPTMTLLTDTAGVTIEAEYNRNANDVVEDLSTDLAELDKVTAELAVQVGDFETALDTAIALCDSYIGGEGE